jgi:hypothetical protein
LIGFEFGAGAIAAAPQFDSVFGPAVAPAFENTVVPKVTDVAFSVVGYPVIVDRVAPRKAERTWAFVVVALARRATAPPAAAKAGRTVGAKLQTRMMVGLAEVFAPAEITALPRFM